MTGCLDYRLSRRAALAATGASILGMSVPNLLAAGHELANHSWSHQAPGKIDDTALEHEILGGQNAVRIEREMRLLGYTTFHRRIRAILDFGL